MNRWCNIDLKLLKGGVAGCQRQTYRKVGAQNYGSLIKQKDRQVASPTWPDETKAHKQRMYKKSY